MRHIREIDLRVHALGIHIHCQCDNIHITGAFPVAEQGAFDTVSAGQKTQFGVSNCTAAVIMGMNA